MYSLLVFNESQMPLIEYTKTVNSTASLVAAIGNIQNSFISGGYYKIQFVTCSPNAIARAGMKKIMKNERQNKIMKQ